MSFTPLTVSYKYPRAGHHKGQMATVCDSKLIRHLANSSPQKVKRRLQQEKKTGHVVKGLLNILHNAVEVGSIPTTSYQRLLFDRNYRLVSKLLSLRTSIAEKKRLLEEYPKLAIAIARLWLAAGL